MKKELIKLSGILCAITLVAALLLAGVNKITEPEILKAAAKASNDAMQLLIPGAEFKKAEGYDNLSVATENGKETGYCVTVTTKGFGGDIEMMVGFNADHSVAGIEILSHSETAGLGAKADSVDFKQRFSGKNPELSVVKVPTENPSEVQAITGATITSKAVKDGIDAAYAVVTEYEGGSK